MADDLVARIQAAIEAKAEKARAVPGPPEWHVGDDRDEWSSPEMVYMWPPEFHTPYEQDKHWRGLQADGTEMAAHIADNDPQTVLRRCETDKRIVDEWLASVHNPYEGKTDDELHEREMHPDYEYFTTEGQRKMWDYSEEPPEGDGWERNTAEGRDGWDRFDYTEESYWRRLLPQEQRRTWTLPRPPSYLVHLAEGYGIDPGLDTEEQQ